jgi:hypothetical protein
MKPGCLSLEEVERNFIFLGSLLFDTAVDHNPDPGAPSHPTRFHLAKRGNAAFDSTCPACNAGQWGTSQPDVTHYQAPGEVFCEGLRR